MDEFQIMIGGIPYTFKGDASGKAAVEALIVEHASLSGERDAAEARADEAESKVTKLTADLDAAKDPAKLDAAAKARASLLEKANRVAGKELEANGSDHEIRLAALDAAKVQIPEDRRDSEVYVSGRFDGRLADLPEASGATVNDAIRNVTQFHPQQGNRPSPLRDARNAHLNRNRERRVG
jgi:hypothetical protein